MQNSETLTPVWLWLCTSVKNTVRPDKKDSETYVESSPYMFKVKRNKIINIFELVYMHTQIFHHIIYVCIVIMYLL